MLKSNMLLSEETPTRIEAEGSDNPNIDSNSDGDTQVIMDFTYDEANRETICVI